MFVHSDSQLRAAHLILGYTPISKSYQARKCIIKAKDPLLHRISVATLGFLITGPIPEDTLSTDSIPKGIPKVALPFQHATEEEATPSQPTINEEEEVVEALDSKDDFEAFIQPLSPKTPLDDLDHPLLVQASQAQRDSLYQKTWKYNVSPR